MSDGVSMSLDATSAAHRPADADAELRSLQELIAAMERAQTNEHVDAFVGLFHRDAMWTTGHGRRLTGREAIALAAKEDGRWMLTAGQNTIVVAERPLG